MIQNYNFTTLGFDEFSSYQDESNKIQFAKDFMHKCSWRNPTSIQSISVTTLDAKVAQAMFECGGCRVWDVSNQAFKNSFVDPVAMALSFLPIPKEEEEEQTPSIKMVIYIVEVNPLAWWPMFSRYHYMSHQSNKSDGKEEEEEEGI